MADTFQEILDGFTTGTLSLINSRNQIQQALDGGTGSGMTNTRTDPPASTTGGIHPVILVLGAVVLFKALAK